MINKIEKLCISDSKVDCPQLWFQYSQKRPSNLRKHGRSTVGRTFADLVFEFKNDNRIMAVIFTIVAFVVFVNRIDDLNSFKFPLITSAILNCVWFGVSIQKALSKWFSSKKTIGRFRVLPYFQSNQYNSCRKYFIFDQLIYQALNFIQNQQLHSSISKRNIELSNSVVRMKHRRHSINTLVKIAKQNKGKTMSEAEIKETFGYSQSTKINNTQIASKGMIEKIDNKWVIKTWFRI
jgi:hypothetical protein